MPDKPELIYVAGPYSADTEEGIAANISAACAIAQRLALLGKHAICPYLNTGGFHTLPIPYEYWMELDANILDRCDALLLMSNWLTSYGTKRELARASWQGKTVYSEADLERWEAEAKAGKEPE